MLNSKNEMKLKNCSVVSMSIIFLLSLSGCFLATHQTGKTLGKGHSEFSFFGTGATLPDSERSPYLEEAVPVVYGGGGLRFAYGMKEHLDIWGRLAGKYLGVGIKKQFLDLKDSNIQSSLLLGVNTWENNQFSPEVSIVVSKILNKNSAQFPFQKNTFGYLGLKCAYLPNLNKSIDPNLTENLYGTYWEDLIPVIFLGIRLPIKGFFKLPLCLSNNISFEIGYPFNTPYSAIYLSFCI